MTNSIPRPGRVSAASSELVVSAGHVLWCFKEWWSGRALKTDFAPLWVVVGFENWHFNLTPP